MKRMLLITAGVVAAIFVAFLAYMIYEPAREAQAKERNEKDSILRGAETYAQYCTVCHGPLGEGCIGPALNTDQNRVGRADQLTDRADFLAKTISRGRGSNQPHTAMPNWGIDDGGQLTQKQISDLVVFIQKGDFNEIPTSDKIAEGSTENKGPDKPPPPLPVASGLDKKTNDDAAALLVSKTCLNCHTVGGRGTPMDAELIDVGSRRTEAWLRAWIQNPPAMAAVDPKYKAGTLTQPSRDVGRGPNLWLATGQQPFVMNTTYMPKLTLTDQEIDTLVRYLIAIRQP